MSFLDQLGCFFLSDERCPFCGIRPGPLGLCEPCRSGLHLGGDSCCQRCGRPLAQPSGLCSNCRRRQPWCFVANRCLGVYGGELAELIHLYKGRGRKQLVWFLAAQLAQLYLRFGQGWPLVPVPPRAGKIWWHGWDQVELLAQTLERRHRLPVLRLLRRHDRTSQKSLTGQQRLSHTQRFSLRRQPALKGCVLLDDLLTTGTTLDRCATLLQAHGVEQVYTLTIAVV